MSSKRTIRNSIIGVAGVATAALLFVGAGSSGADFSASSDGSAQISTATMSLNLSDSDHAHSFVLNFSNLAPGGEASDTFTVKNTGSIPATVKITDLPGTNLGGMSNTDLAKLTYSIDGYGNPMDLGTLGAGESRTYNVRVGLASSAGNEWQGKTVSTGVTVTLGQVH